jgi:hypothetical protein
LTPAPPIAMPTFISSDLETTGATSRKPDEKDASRALVRLSLKYFMQDPD